MKKYIEREAAIRELLNDAPEQVFYSREDAADCIRYITAIDVAPVRNGRWIGVDTSYWRWYHDTARTVFTKSFRCSECGRKTIIREKFCPSCGAKMDKEDADDKEQPEEAPGE